MAVQGHLIRSPAGCGFEQVREEDCSQPIPLGGLLILLISMRQSRKVMEAFPAYRSMRSVFIPPHCRRCLLSSCGDSPAAELFIQWQAIVRDYSPNLAQRPAACKGRGVVVSGLLTSYHNASSQEGGRYADATKHILCLESKLCAASSISEHYAYYML